MRFLMLFLLGFFYSFNLNAQNHKNLGLENQITIYKNPAVAGYFGSLIKLNYIKDNPLFQPYTLKTPMGLNLHYESGPIAPGGIISLAAYHSNSQSGNTRYHQTGGIISFLIINNEDILFTGGIGIENYNKEVTWNFLFPDMLHPLYGPIYQTNQVPPSDLDNSFQNVSIGLTYQYSNLFTSLGIRNVFEPNYSFYNTIYSESVLSRICNISVGYQIENNENVSYQIMVESQLQKDKRFFKVQISTTIKQKLLFGLGLSTNNNASGYLAYQHNNIMLSISGGALFNDANPESNFGLPSYIESSIRIKLK